jgi:hypothetical protein
MFKIRFAGCKLETIIEAENLKSAKLIFAKMNNINNITYIQGSKIK